MNVFILVKTYPTLSRKYDELVCTAGITEDGKWVRIYPLPFRKLDYDKRYRKYQWLDIPLERNYEDIRPESHRPTSLDNMEVGNFVSDWNERQRIFLQSTPVYTNLTELIGKAKNLELSLAIFKPTEILDFVIEDTERDWPKDKLDRLEGKSKQLTFFQTAEEIKQQFSIVEKIPYKFSYRFRDDNGRTSKLMIEDWEIGMLYLNCRSTSKSEHEALQKVKQKYFGDFLKRKIYLFLGTTKEFHSRAPNPFVIVGVSCPPPERQNFLFSF